MNIALIGIGYWGRNYYRILNLNDNINLSSVVDPSPSIKLGSEVQYYTNLDEFLNSKLTIDAAVVSTPTNTHYDIALRCLKKKKDIFIEKPITSTSEQAKKIITIAENNKNLSLIHI